MDALEFALRFKYKSLHVKKITGALSKWPRYSAVAMLKMAFFSFCLATMLFPVMSFAASERCEVVLDSVLPEKTEISPALTAQLDILASYITVNVDAKVLAGERLPNWSDFDKLENLQEIWQSLSAVDPQFLAQYVQQQGPQYLFAKPELATLLQAFQVGLQKIKLASASDGLLRAYFAQLMALTDFWSSDLVEQWRSLGAP